MGIKFVSYILKMVREMRKGELVAVAQRVRQEKNTIRISIVYTNCIEYMIYDIVYVVLRCPVPRLFFVL